MSDPARIRMHLQPAFRAGGLVLALGLALVGPTMAHEDDPKILDRKAPVPGTGYRSAVPGLNGGGIANLGGVSEGINLESWLTMSDLGNGNENGNDCWGYTSPSGREYALMCTTGATVVVEISNPGNPQVIGRITGPNSSWRDVKTYQDRAYAVTEGGAGIQVIDLSDVDNGNISLENTVTGPGTNNTHNVGIDTDSGFLYRMGGGGEGLRIYSLANPSAPAYVGSWSDRYVHDAQIVTFTSGPLAGREIAYCCAGLNGGGTDTGLSIVDVTNKANPVVLDTIAYPNRAYSHQGWLSADRTRFYLGDELDEGNNVSVTTTHIFDVSTPSNAIYLGQFDNGDAAIGHNMYEHNGLLFQANYTSGLRVFDVATNPNAPVEVAYYDTAPTSSSASFNGLWSCYPYFASGTVIGSDTVSGLFVWSVDDPELEIVLPSGAPDLLAPGGQDVAVTINELIPGALDPTSPALVYDIGSGATTVGLSANGGTSYTASFPSLPCGSSVAWYISASSNTGQITTAPGDAPGTTFASLVGNSLVIASQNNMEQAAGWVGGQPGDTATTGIWERGDPNGTDAQPEDDHSAVGTQCWFTGQGNPGAGNGSNDVDGGFTTLVTPTIDMSGLASPIVSYYRWYSNDQGGSANSDIFEVDISNNNGASWTSVEVVGPDGPGTAGGWIQYEFRVSDLVTPTAQMQMRFIASDLGQGSIVEAAIDDFLVSDVACGDGIGTLYCNGNPNSIGQVSTIVGMGSNSLAANNLVLNVVDLPLNTNGYFIVSRDQAFVANPSGSQGNLCVGANTGRYISQIANTGGSGQLQLVVDNTAIPQASGNVAALAGETFNFQCWHRDFNLVVTSNFSRGYSVQFQ